MKAFILLSVFSGVHLCLAIRSSVGNDASDDCWLRDKYSDIGYDVGNYTTVNVGECGGTTPESSAVSGPRTDCAALHTTEERHLLYCGHFVISVDTIQSCQKVPTTCQRLSHFVTFYQGTTFERTINVGVCRGMCRENMTCMSVRNKTKGISTPNGVRLIPKIEKCACVKPHCYRMSNFEAFPEQRPGVKGKVAVTTKTVDMGKCVGVVKCPGRDRKSANFLDLQLKIVPGCMPDKYNHHSFVSYGGRHVNVSAIATCSCYAGD